MGPIRGAMWATAMTRVDGDKGLTCVVPLQASRSHWDPEKAPEMFDKIIKDETDRSTRTLCSTPAGSA